MVKQKNHNLCMWVQFPLSSKNSVYLNEIRLTLLIYFFKFWGLSSSGVEHRTENPCVGGSSPPLGINLIFY